MVSDPPPSEHVVYADAGAWDLTAAGVAATYLAPEDAHLERLLEELRLPPPLKERIIALATSLVTRVRATQGRRSAIDAFMQAYDLSSEEGVLLMCLAEALLRIPDAETSDRLIADKLGEADWESHLGKSSSLFVNASTWGLMLTGRIVRVGDRTRRDFLDALKAMVASSGEPVIRRALRQAMRIMGHQFVMGRTIGEALKRAAGKEHRRYRYSFDMLGEAALTAADAARYFEAYAEAIEAIGRAGSSASLEAAPSISVKLSALGPRYRFSQRERVLAEVAPRLLELARAAKAAGIALTVDAEEADRLQLSLDVVAAVLPDPSLAGWDGFGVVVQAYQKRAPAVLEWLVELARNARRRLPVRLVKGAYWDTEIKRAQEQGLAGYPVFTRKVGTDVSYLYCARRLLDARDALIPQFATHNAQTLAAVYHLAGDDHRFEFQRLHGMGEELYEEVIGPDRLGIPCRVYAPVGSHEDLLPYLVRRLLENGANTSFVNRIVDQELPVAEVVADPIATLDELETKANPRIPLPGELYQARRNSRGVNLADPLELKQLAADIAAYPPGRWRATAPGAGDAEHVVFNPADHEQRVGTWVGTDADGVEAALRSARAAQPDWDRTPVAERAACLERAADLLEARRGLFLSLLVREAGKTLSDSVAELREAVDFCRYYAAQARATMAAPLTLPGPTGESNRLSLHGRGVFVCISPWNFPLAILLGQIGAALVAGNSVVAKPAEQTTLVAGYAIALLHEAGIPEPVLHLVPGEGATVGPLLTADERVAGVAFTGSTETARAINRSLAARAGALPALIAETGGQNAMLADSSALAEQLVADAVESAFSSAGQRCSALRVLFVQRELAPRIIEMLGGALEELRVGDPALLATDVGPVIDAEARRVLTAHCERMARLGRPLGQARLPEWAVRGNFVAPVAYEIDSLDRLEHEVFGPVLHLIRYPARDVDRVIEAINATGYGLTLGVHSRVESTVDYVRRRVRAGNCYVNRNMIGAVVGVQPFGGEGLSGTGPKAGGPHYLPRFTTERTLSVNLAAIGGNAALLALDPGAERPRDRGV